MRNVRILKQVFLLFVCLSSTVAAAPADTSYVQLEGGMVSLHGNVLQDDGGPFLGLGATYMSALRFCKYDRNRLHSDLAFLSQSGFNYVRILTMVGWYEAWDGKEIAPISFQNRAGKYVPAWTDYWQQFRDLIDITYDQYGMRSEITIFADAQLMPNKADRISHMQQILTNLAGREHKVILIEVANEAWQNGFPDSQGIADLREFGQYLADRTSILVALSDSLGQDNASIEQLYSGSAADIATEHFTRDRSEDGWLPVRACWDIEYANGVPPASSNEPIGPGSSVSSENDPIKLVSAAAFAWIAKLPMYVFHSSAGVFGSTRFEDMAGVRDFIHLADILPPDMPNWSRNDGKESSAPFTVYCMGYANTYWTDVSNATNGCHRNIGGIKNHQFVCYPQGILSGGVTLQARQQMTFKVYNPLTGDIVMDATKNTGEHFTLPQGPGAYIIKGTMGPALPANTAFYEPFSYPAAYPNRPLSGVGGWGGSAGSQIQVVDQTLKITGGATSYDAVRYVSCEDGGSDTIWAQVKVMKGTGSATSWSLWIDDPEGRNIARWYGSGATARGRIGDGTQVTAVQNLSGGWDELMVSIRPSTNQSEFFFNGTSIGVLNHAETQAGDTIGRLRFERINNSSAAGQYAYFDDLAVGYPGAGSLGSIDGYLGLADYLGDITRVPITVELRRLGGDTSTRTIYLDSTGYYTMADVEVGAYDLAFNASHWLRRVIPDVQVSATESGAVTSLPSLYMINGDCNGDNRISSVDMTIVRKAYGSRPGAIRWNPDADLNGDGRVSSRDVVIVRKNYGRTGDP